MAGRRPLTDQEERSLIRTARRLRPRDRLLVTFQLFTGFRVHEVLSVRVGQVWRDGQVQTKIGVAPRHLKGHRGGTRWVPLVHELQRALAAYLTWRERTLGPLNPVEPLFVSRKRGPDGARRAFGRSQAYRLVVRTFRAAGIQDDGRLGTHSLRKTLARKVFRLSGNNILVTRDALGHSSIAVTECYLECTREEVDCAILAGDWTRRPRARPAA
jgi:integrase